MHVLRLWLLAVLSCAVSRDSSFQLQSPSELLDDTSTDVLNATVSIKDTSIPLTIQAEKHHCEDIHEALDACEYARLYCSPSSAGMVGYISWYYCDMKDAQPVAFTALVLWTSLLFSTIGIASSDFFCPNLATIANSLGMSQSVAGVTFLAFGNGSPDVFSTFAAFKAHSGSLAIGELLGAAAFITSVVAGVMAIIAPFKVSRRSFLRDAGFFSVAVLMTMVLLADGKVRLWESIVMIVFYCLYVTYVLVGTYINSKGNKRKIINSRIRSRYESEGAETHLVNDNDDDLDADSTRLLAEDRIGVANLESEFSDEESEEHEYKDLTTNMSITGRPMPSSRNSVRPSLLGALEFRELVTGLAEDGCLTPAALKAVKKRPRAHSIVCRPSLSHRAGSRSHSGRADPVSKPIPAGTYSSEAHYKQSSLPAIPVVGQADQIVSLTEHDIPVRGKFRNSARSRSEEPLDNADIASTSLRLQHPIELLSPNIPFKSTPSDMPDIKIDDPETDLAEEDADESLMSVESSPLIPSANTRVSQTENDTSSHGQQLTSPARNDNPDCTCEEAWMPTWWPIAYLPNPRDLRNLLFPTLRDFQGQSHFQRLLSLMATPSVFVLTVTLPVVNPPFNQEQAELNEAGRDLEAVVAKDDADRYTAHQGWNRWLACLQCILTPFLVSLILFFGEPLLIPLLTALGISVALLLSLLFFTEPGKRPRFHTLLCFVGFAVSVCWISTIANEVVGTLQAFGTILGLSDAILGLTVFAVGNSLGDFVADVTVARMGFSQMAISGVFGGPMLNILLGIGISGIYINVSKHHVYNTEISPTLIVSGASLLTTLIILLIAVPANGYVMGRKLGIALCCIFFTGMILSVLVEIYLQSS